MHVSRVWTARLVFLLSTYRYVNWTVCLETSKIFGVNTWALRVAHHIENSYYYESTFKTGFKPVAIQSDPVLWPKVIIFGALW